jgi:hypothetical protein
MPAPQLTAAALWKRAKSFRAAAGSTDDPSLRAQFTDTAEEYERFAFALTIIRLARRRRPPMLPLPPPPAPVRRKRRRKVRDTAPAK